METGWAFQAYISEYGPNVDYFAFTADHCFGAITVVTGQTYDAIIETRALTSARVVATVPLSDGSSVRIDNTFDAYGAADVGLGILAAARALDLDFVPLLQERYDLIIPREFYESDLLAPLLSIIRGPVFRREVEALGGYDASEMGTVVAEI